MKTFQTGKNKRSSNILTDVIEYLDPGGPVVNFPNVDKEITTLAINIYLSSYMESIRNRTL